MKIYLASPFFNDKERKTVENVASILRKRGFEVFVPMEHSIDSECKLPNDTWANMVYHMDTDAIMDSDFLLAIYYGMESDSGTAFEIGYAKAKNIPIYLLVMSEENNLMCIQAASGFIYKQELLNKYEFKDNNQVFERLQK